MSNIDCSICNSKFYNYKCACGTILCIKCWNNLSKQEEKTLSEIVCPKCNTAGEKEKLTDKLGKEVPKKEVLKEKKEEKKFIFFRLKEDENLWKEENISPSSILKTLFIMIYNPFLGIKKAIIGNYYRFSLVILYTYTLIVSFLNFIPLFFVKSEFNPIFFIRPEIASIPVTANLIIYIIIFNLIGGLVIAIINTSIITVLWLYIGAKLFRGKSSLLQNIIMVGYSFAIPTLLAFFILIPLYSYMCNKYVSNQIRTILYGVPSSKQIEEEIAYIFEQDKEKSLMCEEGNEDIEIEEEIPQTLSVSFSDAFDFWYNIINDDYIHTDFMKAFKKLSDYYGENPLLLLIFYLRIILYIYGIVLLFIGVKTINKFTWKRTFLAFLATPSIWICLNLVIYYISML